VDEESHGVPTGLIILAARNQFCHWNEPNVHEQTKAVFNARSAPSPRPELGVTV